MNETEGVEKSRVRTTIEEYLGGKKEYDFEGFGNFEKIKLGGNTWIYVVEVEMKNWDNLNYALVPVIRAYPLGIVMMTSSQIARVVEALIDGLSRPF